MTGCDASSSAGDSAARPDHDGPEIGRAYRQVVELRPDLRVGRKEHLTVIFAGDDQVHLDLEGRLHRAWLDGISYQRGLDGRMRGVRIDRPDPKERWLEMLQQERNISPEQYRRDIIWPTLALRQLASNRLKVTPEQLAKEF